MGDGGSQGDTFLSHVVPGRRGVKISAASSAAPDAQVLTAQTEENYNATVFTVNNTFAPAASFFACSTPLAASVQNTSESFACSLGLLTAVHSG
ncbi:MAG: hypothetical protein FRX49_10357 [Trebouxia sp. A1-2]|nr:MAG: hypothetical protein FRX49_10357 [Trebouxia sp. A1-2]